MNIKTITVKQAEHSDIEHLTALLLELDQFHFDMQPNKFRSPKEMAQKRIEKDIFSLYHSGKINVFLATCDGKTIGMVSGQLRDHESIISKPKKIGFVNELVVVESYRGTSAATQLVDAIEQHFAEQGAAEFSLNVASFNQRALNFYSKVGYASASQQLTKTVSSR